MLDLSQRQLLELWSELDDAYHGQNGYGGDTAEIYAHRLQPADFLTDPTVFKDLREPAREKRAAQAVTSLTQVLGLFCEMRDCTVEVDGLPLAEWPPHGYQFGWRAYVKVKK